MVTVRDARLEDAATCAGIHVASWKAAYRGMLPDEYLDALSIDDRLPSWQQFLDGSRSPARTMVVVDDDGVVRGFATIRPSGADAEAELAALYLDPLAQGLGLGRALLDAFMDRARHESYLEAVLWVHPSNHRARRFYERAGWTDDGVSRLEAVWGLDVPEQRYRVRL